MKSFRKQLQNMEKKVSDQPVQFRIVQLEENLENNPGEFNFRWMKNSYMDIPYIIYGIYQSFDIQPSKLKLVSALIKIHRVK